MLYSIIRLGLDGIYVIGKLSYDGIHYMLYGSQPTESDLLNKEIIFLKNRIDNDSIELREMKNLIKAIAEKNQIDLTNPAEDEEDLVYIP